TRQKITYPKLYLYLKKSQRQNRLPCHQLAHFPLSLPAPTAIYTLSLHDALPISRISLRGRSAASLRQNCVTVFSFSKNHFSSPSGRWSIVLLISSWGSTL